MNYDSGKGMNIRYNYLNLPEFIEFSNCKIIEYTYDATGLKLRKTLKKGNARITFTDKNGNGVIDITGNAETNEVLEENHYYAFGMQMEGAWMENLGRENKYLYNGKELDTEFGKYLTPGTGKGPY